MASGICAGDARIYFHRLSIHCLIFGYSLLFRMYVHVEIPETYGGSCFQVEGHYNDSIADYTIHLSDLSYPSVDFS